VFNVVPRGTFFIGSESIPCSNDDSDFSDEPLEALWAQNIFPEK
jgi:hypothetical protein